MDVRKHWQQIMDTDKDNSMFQRHVNFFTTNIYEQMRKETNFTFFRVAKGFETDIVTTLSKIVSEILNEHPKIGRETHQTKERYALNVLIPEGVEKFLMHKFNMSEAQAKKCYREHHVIECDFCDLYFNQDSDNDEHFEKVHKSSVDLENHIRDILAVGTISKKIFQKRLEVHYDKKALSLRKKEINKLYVKVKNEIKEKKEALEEDDDFLFVDLD